jgi:uncharacterized damage-inducible protein DinB
MLMLCSGLGDAELDREFDLGHRSLRRTFRHIVANMECWCDLMAGKPQRFGGLGAGTANSIGGLVDRLDVVGAELVALGNEVARAGREDEFFVDYLDDPPTRKPLGGGLVHVATHGMHHRGQCLYLMRQLGVKGLIEGDELSWELQHLGLDHWPHAK